MRQHKVRIRSGMMHIYSAAGGERRSVFGRILS